MDAFYEELKKQINFEMLIDEKELLKSPFIIPINIKDLERIEQNKKAD